MLGRVWAALMVADPPEMTAEELAEYLQASRGSISHATRQLIDLGIVRRVSKPGMRKDFFRVAKDAWARAYTARLHAFGQINDIFLEGLTSMQDASAEAQASIRDAIDFYEFWKMEVANMMERWETHKEQSRD